MTSPPRRVGFIRFDDARIGSIAAAWAWLAMQAGWTAEHCGPARLAASLADHTVAWLHLADEAAYATWRRVEPEVADVLRAFVEQGGRLLLTGHAALLPHDLGWEPVRPQIQTVRVTDEGFGRKRGFQSFRGHPLFAPFHGGLYLWDAHEDTTVARVGYVGTWPAQGRVLAVDRAYIRQFPDERLVVEHRIGAGCVLSVGGYLEFDRPNHLRAHLEAFVEQALTYLHELPEADAGTVWQPDPCRPQPLDLPERPAATLPEPTDLRARSATDLALERAATDAAFDVGGRRCVLMGSERGGVAEVWTYPFRALLDLEIGLVDDKAVTWLREVTARVEVRPEALLRTYPLPGGGTLTETLFAARGQPGAVVHLQVEDAGPLQIVVRCRCDLRLMWPYHPDAYGSLHVAYDDALQALRVQDRTGAVVVLAGADRAPAAHRTGAYARIEVDQDELAGQPAEANEIAHAARFEVTPEAPLTYAIAGTDQGTAEAEATLAALRSDPLAVYDEAAAHVRDLLATATMLTTPDPAFDEGYRWAVVGADRCWGTTPGLGTALLAGFGTSDSGWDGGHAVSGRPGYAWYFGRDAAWMALAILGYGDAASVREQLAFFARFQDLDGKIFHELTTSGAVHYDAADATPLYLILAAHYLRASGDLAFIRDLWPSLRRALAFCYATDTDGDGLIENTNVGHGWIEGGPLFGAHVTLYLAGLWARALYDAAYLAGHVEAYDLCNRLEYDSWAVQQRIERDFWNEAAGCYRYALRRDGTYVDEPTLMPATLMHGGLLDPGRAAPMLEAYAGPAFSTDWGVRLVRADSPLYNPVGYHYGSVWPLYTGWTALAEYAYARPVQGFVHVMNTLRLYRTGALGVIDEMLHGEVFEPAGVCPHQGWSETAVLHPILSGMLGVRRRALEGVLHLRPRLPWHWDDVQVDNLWIGATRLSVQVKRTVAHTRYRFEVHEGPPVTVRLAPDLPAGRRITKALLDGLTVEPGRRGRRGLLDPPLSFELEDVRSVIFEHAGGIAVLPPVPDPVPGAASTGVRLLGDDLNESVYTLRLEGPAGSEADVQVRLFGETLDHVDGAEVASPDERGIVTLHVAFPAGDGYVPQTVALHLAVAGEAG